MAKRKQTKLFTKIRNPRKFVYELYENYYNPSDLPKLLGFKDKRTCLKVLENPRLKMTYLNIITLAKISNVSVYEIVRQIESGTCDYPQAQRIAERRIEMTNKYKKENLQKTKDRKLGIGKDDTWEDVKSR